jgi:hypothetical protein
MRRRPEIVHLQKPRYSHTEMCQQANHSIIQQLVEERIVVPVTIDLCKTLWRWGDLRKSTLSWPDVKIRGIIKIIRFLRKQAVTFEL